MRDVYDIVDSSHAVEAEQILFRGGRQAAFLPIKSLFLGNTEEGSRMKLSDWTLYCRMMYKGTITDIRDVQWPPRAECCVRFYIGSQGALGQLQAF